MRFHDRVVIVAGGGSGIGEAAARRLASEGARVVVGDLVTGNAEKVAGEIGGLAVHYDQADEASVAALVERAVEEYGRLDGLHANAADMGVLARDTDAVDIDLEAFDRTLEVGLRGYLLLTRHAVPRLLEAGGGAIVYTSSGAAFAGEPERVGYGVAKSGINALMRHVASRWGKEGVRANSIAPGVVLTEQLKNSLPEKFRNAVLRGQRLPRLGDPADIAASVAFLLSEDASWITGQVLSVDGGATMR